MLLACGLNTTCLRPGGALAIHQALDSLCQVLRLCVMGMECLVAIHFPCGLLQLLEASKLICSLAHFVDKPALVNQKPKSKSPEVPIAKFQVPTCALLMPSCCDCFYTVLPEHTLSFSLLFEITVDRLKVGRLVWVWHWEAGRSCN